MSKHCILINGTMGVGKTTVCKELMKLLPASVFLDGDWCWYSHPFTVTEQTKQVVMENIGFTLKNFSEMPRLSKCYLLLGNGPAQYFG